MTDRSIAAERRAAVGATMTSIRQALMERVDVDSIEAAKAALLQLAARGELFSDADFPIPGDSSREMTYCIHRDPDGQNALYVYVAEAGASYGPHDHGAAWAIVAAVAGQEKHYLYRREDGGTGPGKAEIRCVGDLTCEPGHAVSLLPGGIHAIEAVGGAPIRHLHCYGCTFERQTTRLEYDIDAGTCRTAISAGVITDRRDTPADA